MSDDIISQIEHVRRLRLKEHFEEHLDGPLTNRTFICGIATLLEALTLLSESSPLTPTFSGPVDFENQIRDAIIQSIRADEESGRDPDR